MSRAFRWLGPGVFRDIMGGQARVYMGQRTDDSGKLLEGEIVREHTVAPEKLEVWVKAGTAEYVNLAEKVVSSLKGGGQSEEAKREAEAHQRAKDQADASARLETLTKVRRIMASKLFDDDDRALVELELQKVPVEKLTDFVSMVEGELRKRQDAKGKDKKSESSKEPAGPVSEGAGPK